ncbi:MAG: dTDP-4-dehydrorhamnose 3,5-epimerase [Deltaproteobacteria bacterium]|nr:dTDP-4-dehydrorhamnose 3,5-epimerase [Deltaproteobacteria bacterium]
MKPIPTEIPEVLLVPTRVFHDERGYFLESYVAERYRRAGIASSFVQDNCSRSHAGVLRGLHFQRGAAAQDKLVRVTRGRVFDVAVDLRRGSPTFKRWVGVVLSADEAASLFIPAGFAHGFCALTEADLEYKCSAYYSPADERGVAWDDPDLGIEWPIERPAVSARDRALPRLAELAEGDLPSSASLGLPTGGHA